jgi:hypothetical protein
MPVSFPPQNTERQNRKISQTENSPSRNPFRICGASVKIPEGIHEESFLLEQLTDQLQLRIWDLPVCTIKLLFIREKMLERAEL